MRTLKGALSRAAKKAKETGKDAYVGLNLGGYYYVFIGSCPAAYASVAKVSPDGTVVKF